MSVRRYTITEYEPGHPWLVVRFERCSVELPDDVAFAPWAAEHHPGAHLRVVEEPGGRGHSSCA